MPNPPTAHAAVQNPLWSSPDMADAHQIERWEHAESALRAALSQLRPLIPPKDASFTEEFLDHNELGLAMDTLVEATLASSVSELPPGIQSHLRRASTEMDGLRAGRVG